MCNYIILFLTCTHDACVAFQTKEREKERESYQIMHLLHPGKMKAAECAVCCAQCPLLPPVNSTPHIHHQRRGFFFSFLLFWKSRKMKFMYEIVISLRLCVYCYYSLFVYACGLLMLTAQRLINPPDAIANYTAPKFELLTGEWNGPHLMWYLKYFLSAGMPECGENIFAYAPTHIPLWLYPYTEYTRTRARWR